MERMSFCPDHFDVCPVPDRPNLKAKKHHGHHVLDQTFSAPHGQGQSKADTTTLERSTPPASTIGEAPTVEDRPPPSVEGSDDPSTTPLAPQSPDQSVEDDPKAYPEGGLRAWLVVLGSFSGMAASFGLMNTVGTFQAYLITHQLASYPPSAVGWIFGLYVFLSFFCGVQIGPIFDAKGPRWIVVSGTICLLTGMVGLAFSTEFWHFILTFSILCGLGTSLIFTPAIASIAHFFFIRRANATGIAATGGSVGGIVFPLMLQALFPRIGFRYATLVMALISCFLLVLANILIRSRLPPRPGGSVFPDFRIFRHKIFTLTTLGIFFMEWGLFVPISYISSYALSHGVNTAFSYQLLAVVNAGSVFGRWLPGYVADKLGRFNTMIITIAMCLVCVLGLWLTAGGNVAQLCVFAVGFGFASGSNISLTPVCIGQLCETDVFGRWYATCYTIVSFGCLTGIPIAGQILSYDNGEYRGLIVFTGVCYVASLICFVAARNCVVGWDPRKIY